MKKNIYVMLMAAALIGLLTGCGGKKDVAYQSNSSAIDNFDFEIEETGVGEGDEYGVESLDFYDGEPGSEAEEMSEANTATNEPVYAEEGNADMKFAVRSAKGFLALPELTGTGTLAWADVAGEETIPTLSKSAGDVLATWIVLDKCTVEAAEAQYVVPLQLRGNSEATEYEIHDPYDLDYMNIMGALSPKSLSEQVRAGFTCTEVNGRPVNETPLFVTFMSDESDSFFGYVSGELGENVTLGCYQETEYKEISTICNAVAFRGIGEETPLTTERTKEGYEVINTESLVPGVYRMYVFYNLGGTGGSESHYYAFRIVD